VKANSYGVSEGHPEAGTHSMDDMVTVRVDCDPVSLWNLVFLPLVPEQQYTHLPGSPPDFEAIGCFHPL
jgi:hypothetical protein